MKDHKSDIAEIKKAWTDFGAAVYGLCYALLLAFIRLSLISLVVYLSWPTVVAAFSVGELASYGQAFDLTLLAWITGRVFRI